MKRLSGMMRIYISISAIYILVSATFAMYSVSQSQSNTYQIFKHSCRSEFSISTQQTEYRECVDDAYTKSKALGTTRRVGSLLAYSVLPLMIFWIFGFISLRLYRWVRAGFVNT
jgi:hypothetical protein